MRTIATLLVATLLPAFPARAELSLTPAQTEGPYYPSRLKPAETDNDLTRLGNGPQAKGDVLVIKGMVVDPTEKPIAGALVEIWQTDSQGIYLHPDDGGFARRDKAFQFYGTATSDAAGAVTFRTILPARYTGRARHIHVKITPPGGATLTTQLYFAGDADLSRDGIARRLGKALTDISLSPKPSTEAGVQEAGTRFVVRRGRGG